MQDGSFCFSMATVLLVMMSEQMWCWPRSDEALWKEPCVFSFKNVIACLQESQSNGDSLIDLFLRESTSQVQQLCVKSIASFHIGKWSRDPHWHPIMDIEIKQWSEMGSERGIHFFSQIHNSVLPNIFLVSQKWTDDLNGKGYRKDL